MPRKWEETVKPFEPLKENHRYLLQVSGVSKCSKAAICLTLEHVAGHSQAGRVHTLTLPLPIRPDGLTAEFFRAVGIQVQVDTKVAPKDAFGRQVYVKFSLAEGQNEPKVVTFEPVPAQATAPGTANE
jgi:hypothetical protein